MKNLKISVIIPTKNEEICLEKTLKQYFLIKDKLNIEIIVSDAGSTDNTINIAKMYADKVVLARNGEKQNIAKGRNDGSKVANGKILFHTDADVIIPKKEEFFSKILETFEKENIVGATTILKVYPNEEKINDRLAHFIFNNLIKLANKFGSFLAKGECQIIKADAFRNIGGYNEKIVVGEDCDLFYRLNKTGRIKFMNNLVVYHSPRRFRKEGYLKVLLIYVKEGLSLLFKGKSNLSEWKAVR